MANDGELPDVDMLKVSPGDLDLPALDLSLDLPAPSDTQAPQSLAAAKPAAAKGHVTVAKKPSQAPKQGKAPTAKPAAAASNSSTMPLLLSLISIILLIVVAAVMIVFEVPVNSIPDLTLTTYVQGLWLVVGCFFIVAMLQDIRTALMITGLNIVLLATVFPTLWLIMDMPMNPMYFFVLGMILLIAGVLMPMNLLRPKAATPAKA